MVPLPQTAQLTALDDVLYRVPTEIRLLAPEGQAPAAQVPDKPTVDVQTVMPDVKEEE